MPVPMAFHSFGVNRLQSLTPPFSDNSTSCRADRRSDPTPNDSSGDGRWKEKPRQDYFDRGCRG
jgi:hypothetical protein